MINTAVIKVEHFEISSYRGLITGARLMMGQYVVVDDLLETNFQQEKEPVQIAEQSGEEVLQEVMRAERAEGEGLLDKLNKARSRLMGQ